MPNVRIIAKGQRGDSLTKLKVNFTPTQSGTPWQSDEVNNAPYVFRQVPMGNREWNKLVGGTVAWNQLLPLNKIHATQTVNQVTMTNNGDGSISFSGTATTLSALPIAGNGLYFEENHVYFLGEGSNTVATYDGYAGDGFRIVKWNRASVSTSGSGNAYYAYVAGGATASGTFNANVTDLTLMLGSTLADYVYSLEQATAGRGVEWLKNYDLIDDQYHAYSAGSLESVNVSGHVMRDADNNIIETYPIDSSVTLRGIPKKDADGNLYYDGDTYEWDGTVTRNYRTRAYQAGDESLTDAITDGTTTVYKLTTPTTESADPYTALQVCDPDGTEEWTDYGVEQGTRDYAVPVGHESTYAMAYPIEGVDSFTVTADDGTTHTYPVTLSEEIYRGYVDMLTGEAVSDMASIAEYNGETISEPWLSSLDVYSAGATPTNGAQVVYPITPEEVTATITGDPTELGKVTSVSSTEGTVEWSAMAPLDGKCIVRVVS